MILASSLQRSSHPLKNGHRSLANPLRPYRNVKTPKYTRLNYHTDKNLQFSASRTTVGSFKLQASIPPAILQRTPHTSSRWPPMRCDQHLGARFASTAANASPIAELQPDFSPPSSQPVFSEDGFSSTPLDDIMSSAPPPVYEHIGFLKELGLDYGWGPTALAEWLLEHVHIYTGTPWWASIGLTLILTRCCMLKIYFNAADAAARNQLIAERNAPIMDKLKTSQRNGDAMGLQMALSEMRELRASAGVKLSNMLWPTLQIPIGFGFFRLMRGISSLPVPGLDDGGLLWMRDLTLSDPYFILPVATAGAYYYSFKKGGEAGTLSGANPMISPAAMRIMVVALPTFSGVVMLAWPGALQLTFFIQSIITLVQTSFLRMPWFRDLIGIQPLPDITAKPNNHIYTGRINKTSDAEASPQSAGKGFAGGARADMKSLWSSVKDKANEYQQRQNQSQSGKRTAAELKHAKAYDERRKRELAQEKFEREQEAASKLQEIEEKRKARKGKLRH